MYARTRHIYICIPSYRNAEDGYNHIELNLKETEYTIKVTAKPLRIIQYTT